MDATKRNSRYYVGSPTENQSDYAEPQSPVRSHQYDEDSQEQRAMADHKYTQVQSSRGFMERFDGAYRPEVTLLISPERRISDATSHAPQEFTSADMAADRRDRLNVETTLLPKRTASVSERSPLQNLEAKLGDISKEEKRARVEQAEQRARQRASLGNNKSVAAPNGQSSQTVHRKPVPQGNAVSERVDSRRRAERNQPTSPRMEQEPEDSGRSVQPGPRSEQRHTAVETNASSQRAPPDSFKSVRTRGGGYGHDAALTGGAAAAAIDAYQAVRRRRYDDSPSRPSNTQDLNTSPRISNFSHEQSQRRMQDTEVEKIQDSRNLAYADEDPNQEELKDSESRNRNRDKEHKSLSTRITEKFVPKAKHTVPPAAVAQSGSKGVTYEQPPQVDTGVYARKAVDFGVKNPNEEALRRHEESEHRRIHFSDIIDHHHDSERRYEAPKTLEEWTNAGTATLVADDFDLDGARDEGQQRRLNGRGTDNHVRPDATNGKRLHSDSRANRSNTTFQPMLMLKCGPLLRYAGIRKSSEGSREFWRGTVMIVTEDATSMYRPVPTLKLFKQHMDLLPPPPLRIDGETGQELAPEYVDPLAGQPTTSRTGQTLYVRPVHHLPAETDLSRVESDDGLFEQTSTAEDDGQTRARTSKADGLTMGRFREVKGFRLHAERGVTFWRFNIQVELGAEQTRVAYCINNGPAIGFWVPGKGQMMNVMFHSCNGFSMSVDSNLFSGPDPMWRDVLNSHQTRPFHCMIGGGDQIYNDAAMRDTEHFKEWLGIKNPMHKHSAPFTTELQEELEHFYLNRYSMWFSQGLFGMANSQIPMVNIWDDHDIIDGFGSYPHHFMAAPVFAGLGAVAFKYYMLFQHQSLPDEDERTEPSWLLGASPGPYINQLSRNVFMSLGRDIVLLGLDCRTERMRDEILSQETYDIVFDRCRREIIYGETKHLIVLLGVPIAYPRLNWLENVLTSKAMEPFKALGRMGMLGNFVNKFDGGVEILDDLDDHWTAKHHKQERNWFIQELQELAAEKSVRVTILGGDVHLGAVGQFYSNPKLSIPKDRDHRYMPNVISSAIVNTPPPEMMADVLNKRNKVHHLDDATDEDMIPLFTQDVDGKSRKNHHLLPRRNWCSFREYNPGSTPRSSPTPDDDALRGRTNSSMNRSVSLTRRDPQRGNLLRRISSRKGPPPSAYRSDGSENPYNSADLDPRVDGPVSIDNHADETYARESQAGDRASHQGSFRRRPTSLSRKASRKDKSGRDGHIDLHRGIEITLNCEVDQKDPAGVTFPYRLLVPALSCGGRDDPNTADMRSKRERMANFIGVGRNRGHQHRSVSPEESREEAQRGQWDQTRSAQRNHSFDDQDEKADESRAFSNSHEVQRQPSLNQGQDRPGSQERSQTTASLQRASLDSERNQPSESTISRLPRSQAPDESQAFFRRHSAKNRNNIAQGPPPPSNIDQLPTSVQKRYQQLNDSKAAQGDESSSPRSQKSQNYQSSPRSQKSQNYHSSPDRGSSGPTRHTLYDRPIATAPSSGDQDRHYYSGPMEAPLLPVNANQIRSGNKRNNLDPLLVDSSQSQSSPNNSDNTRRVVSGPAAFQQPQQETAPAVQTREKSRQSLPPARTMAPQIGESRAPQQFKPNSTHNDGYARNSTYLEYTPDGPAPRRVNDNRPTSDSPDAQQSRPQQQRQRSGSKFERHYGGLDGGASRPTMPMPGTYETEMQLETSTRNGVVYTDAAHHDRDDAHSEEPFSEIEYEGRLDRPTHTSGMPEKVARHFAGYNSEDDNRDNSGGASGTKSRPGGGLSGLVRRFSESGREGGKKGWKMW